MRSASDPSILPVFQIFLALFNINFSPYVKRGETEEELNKEILNTKDNSAQTCNFIASINLT